MSTTMQARPLTVRAKLALERAGNCGSPGLLAALAEGDGMASQALALCGVTGARVRDIAGTPGERMVRVVGRATEEAGELGHGFVGTEHLLLALLRDEAVLQVLARLQVPGERVRAASMDVMGVREQERRLMMQVERVVRPIGAMAWRKLRMRRELLGHLQSAVEEERGRGAEMLEAVGAAMARLGPAEKLREDLQRSVPWVERWFLGRIPLPKWYERWEIRSAMRMETNGMTLGQTALVLVVAFVSVVASMLMGAPVVFTKRPEMVFSMTADPARWALGNVLAGAISIVLLGVCWKLMGRWIQGQLRAPGLTAAAGGLLVVWVSLITNVLAQQPITAGEVGMAAAAFAVLVGLLAAGAKMVAMLRRPYRQWLDLEVAGA